MTPKQEQYLRTLCRASGEAFDPTLTVGQASAEISRLQTSLMQDAFDPEDDFFDRDW